jgi:hypothetical protein
MAGLGRASADLPGPANVRQTVAAQQLAPSQHLVRVVVRAAPRGIPVVGADVLVYPDRDLGQRSDHAPFPAASGVTDAQGIARFVLQGGAVTFVVRHVSGEVTQRWDVNGPVDVVVETRGGVAFAPLTVIAKRGIVPLANEAVRLADGRTFRTDDTGTAVLPVPPGRYRLECAGQQVDVVHRAREVVVVALPAEGPPESLWEPADAETDPPAGPSTFGGREGSPFGVEESSPFGVAGAAVFGRPRPTKSRRGATDSGGFGSLRRGAPLQGPRGPDRWENVPQPTTASFQAQVTLED